MTNFKTDKIVERNGGLHGSIKDDRDYVEVKRSEKMGKNFVKELYFKDTLYALFAKLYREQLQFPNSKKYVYVRRDNFGRFMFQTSFRGEINHNPY